MCSVCSWCGNYTWESSYLWVRTHLFLSTCSGRRGNWIRTEHSCSCVSARWRVNWEQILHSGSCPMTAHSNADYPSHLQMCKYYAYDTCHLSYRTSRSSGCLVLGALHYATSGQHLGFSLFPGSARQPSWPAGNARCCLAAFLPILKSDVRTVLLQWQCYTHSSFCHSAKKMFNLWKMYCN